MKGSTLKTASVEQLVEDLASHDPMRRQSARNALVELGTREVTAALVGELIDPRDQVRWEAAKALSTVADPVSAPALLNALEDDLEGVRWLAAEGLVAIGELGVTSVLSGLIKRSGSTTLCQGAHHVLHDASNPANARILSPVLSALSAPEPAVNVPPAAFQALMELKLQS